MPQTIAKTPTGIGRQAVIWNECEAHGFQVRLYETMVYEESVSGDKITLDNGGWITPTTARYMEQALRYRGIEGHVNIKGGEMYFDGKPFVNGKYVIEVKR